jgi:hypothetical protein
LLASLPSPPGLAPSDRRCGAQRCREGTCVVPEQPAQLRNELAFFRNGLGFELTRCLPDLFGCQLHRHLLPFCDAQGRKILLARDPAPSTSAFRRKFKAREMFSRKSSANIGPKLSRKLERVRTSPNLTDVRVLDLARKRTPSLFFFPTPYVPVRTRRASRRRPITQS